ncbi:MULTISPECIES: hypothetical protein [Pseudomonas]|jgi:hypothetical protein|uniref:Uncharacterized protein n=1 Tax=Pseudomonas jessenii TaxID=77298 RepID=A0A370SK50_PSEJE|nr:MULTISPECIES: hypothetical protein [Pseudomonas]MBK3466259.1 hypothetical protein [Pseudomonas sp. MF6776]RDL20119.1 hypothetical protein DEU51_107268 [Pseudomonas jessenii]
MGISNSRSFLAKIKFDDADIVFFDKHPFGKNYEFRKSHITTSHGPEKSGDALASYSPARWDGPDYAYFIGHDDYTYKIQFRSGTNHALYLGAGVKIGYPLGAFTESNTTGSFALFDANLNVVTLDDITTNNASVYLKLNQGDFIKRQVLDDKVYTFSGQQGTLVKLNIEIVERGFDDLANYGFSRSAQQFLRLDSN